MMTTKRKGQHGQPPGNTGWVKLLSKKVRFSYLHRRRSGWNSAGDAWRALKLGRCRVGVGYGEGCPVSSRLGGLGSVVSSPSGVPDRKRILAYFEGHRTLLFVPIWQKSEGTIRISVSYYKFWGDLSPASPCDLRPWLSAAETYKMNMLLQ